MALFSSTKKNTATTPAGSSAAKQKALAYEDGRLSMVLTKPHFSEKALLGTERGVYVFEVAADATKPEIAAAIEKFYGVTPAKIRTNILPRKTVALRTRRGQGVRALRHKAYVYLKKGDTINFA